ncbi:GNAT family N-acetyltransferase [Paenibacillaceae bacterium WGS1546]|uniref:GNAT family N-acetyltransferase n=1 Tax=Cohnella sp. WGS1546 TaxID=3366810 RepID=UPI00372D8137
MIRWRRPRDDKSIVELVRSELVPISPWQHPRDSRLHADIVRRMRRGATLVASSTARGPVIGFLHMEFRHPEMLIDLLAVDSRYQNRKLGTELMLQAERYARNKGFAAARVFVDEENVRGIRFYRRLGYTRLREFPALKIVEMAKSLTPYEY